MNTVKLAMKMYLWLVFYVSCICNKKILVFGTYPRGVFYPLNIPFHKREHTTAVATTKWSSPIWPDYMVSLHSNQKACYWASLARINVGLGQPSNYSRGWAGPKNLAQWPGLTSPT